MIIDANLWLLAAAALSLVTLGIHVFVGGPETVGPLLTAQDLSAIPRATAYYCWHLVSITLGIMAAAFGMASITGVPDGAVIATALASAFTIWNVILIVSRQLPWFQMGQWALFGPITIVGVLGLV